MKLREQDLFAASETTRFLGLRAGTDNPFPIMRLTKRTFLPVSACHRVTFCRELRGILLP